MSAERWFEFGPLWVHVREWAPDTSRAGSPVVLVHGLGGSTLNWELVAPALADMFGTRVIALDLPGFGRTRAPDHPATFELHRSVVTHLLESTGPAIVFGNSMGGSLATSIAAHRAELIDALVLVNAAYPRPVGSLDAMSRTVKFAALTLPKVAIPVVHARAARLGPERLVDTTLAAVLDDPTRMDPDLRARHVDLAEQRRDYPEAARAYAHSGGTLFRYIVTEMRADLAAIHAPTLVIHGRRDRLVPVSFARSVARRRSDWHYVEFADCGHAPQIEIPGRFLDVVTRWVDRELRGPAGPA
ncbi:MAG: alpha/beta fold hydrolase [Acidimicrobiia bacterium]